MLRILMFKNIYLLPVLAIVTFYIIPSFLGVLYGKRPLAAQLLELSSASVVTYLLFYKILSGFWFSSLYNSTPKIKVETGIFTWLILIIYFSVVVYACFTAPQIALVAAIKGGTLSELSGLREEFLRTREGWERILLYIYAIGISSLVPLVIAQMFLKKSKFKFLILGLFLLSLALTLEKGRALVAMLPLVVLFVNSGNRKKAYGIIFCLAAMIALVSVVARGALTSDEQSNDPGPMAGVPDEYNLFVGETSQFYYIVNRVWYIPYVTAIDWLSYKKEILKDETISGKSIAALAWLLGEEKINLEQEVFSFEWGQNDTGTGSANTVYYVDAYLNFGYLGVLIYSMLFAYIVRVCVLSKNRALMACLAISVYYVCFHSLSAVLFSGGLGFLFAFALLFKVKNLSESVRRVR
ncbi:hypothetical protein QN366_02425 [Pseudomonas sp. CCC3.2]|uniref:hypothetical protein n=1 Tax=unclassified Pseudomonas TaxID=196821 RepID=UPI002AB39843|nr:MULTISPECIES: hypothetical protein [unclassified Pseudomonas]MDY7561397.1 hypothetical protein [Pseudomonas sp. AB6]MEB0178929.1 hypothetical protein [Pseudomonas sp. CCC3.2]MEB0210193.1 hypothetical protein [Pseudomonas sp. AB6]